MSQASRPYDSREEAAHEDLVRQYLREIGGRHLLSAREERELGRCVEDGRVLDDTALQVAASAAGARRPRSTSSRT